MEAYSLCLKTPYFLDQGLRGVAANVCVYVFLFVCLFVFFQGRWLFKNRHIYKKNDKIELFIVKKVLAQNFNCCLVLVAKNGPNSYTGFLYTCKNFIVSFAIQV